MITKLAIENYRSLRKVVLPLKKLNVVTGANGSGKSSVYRALRLLVETSQNRVVSCLAREGGLASTLWAGPEKIGAMVREGAFPVEGTRRQEVVRLLLGFAEEDFGYMIDLGLPTPSTALFPLDPVIKREVVWHGELLTPASQLVDRSNMHLRVRNEAWETVSTCLRLNDSMMAQFANPEKSPEILEVRERLRSWRFYDQFRTDADAPVRRQQVATYTPVLGNDGDDLAAALKTIDLYGDGAALARAISQAFPGSRLEHGGENYIEVSMWQHGLLRPLRGAELSDGTLRYLLLVAALLSLDPPRLLVLNEPENSLHPELIPALASLIIDVAQKTQIIVVSHSPALVAALEKTPDCNSLRLEKDFGETRLAGQGRLEKPRWNWASR